MKHLNVEIVAEAQAGPLLSLSLKGFGVQEMATKAFKRLVSEIGCHSQVREEATSSGLRSVSFSFSRL